LRNGQIHVTLYYFICHHSSYYASSLTYVDVSVISIRLHFMGIGIHGFWSIY